jgi:DNA invertase Pin-like site-specific DNA recombinase
VLILPHRCPLIEEQRSAPRGALVVGHRGLGDLMHDAQRGRFEVVLVWASDRIARSVKHFLEILDEFSDLNIEFVSFGEQIDTGGPLGRAVVTRLSFSARSQFPPIDLSLPFGS